MWISTFCVTQIERYLTNWSRIKISCIKFSKGDCLNKIAPKKFPQILKILRGKVGRADFYFCPHLLNEFAWSAKKFTGFTIF